jgi:hypothetical protein
MLCSVSCCFAFLQLLLCQMHVLAEFFNAPHRPNKNTSRIDTRTTQKQTWTIAMCAGGWLAVWLLMVSSSKSWSKVLVDHLYSEVYSSMHDIERDKVSEWTADSVSCTRCAQLVYRMQLQASSRYITHLPWPWSTMVDSARFRTNDTATRRLLFLHLARTAAASYHYAKVLLSLNVSSIRRVCCRYGVSRVPADLPVLNPQSTQMKRASYRRSITYLSSESPAFTVLSGPFHNPR